MTSHYYSQQGTLNSRQSRQSSFLQPKDQWIGRVVCKNYKILSKINEGSFGKVYKAIHEVKQEYYAVKIESTEKKEKKKVGDTLLQEAQILLALKGEKGFPRLYYYVQDPENRIIVETLLGKNLDQLFIQCKKIFSLKTVLLLMDQAINRLEYLHKSQYIHRDIKPENFLIGTGVEENTIYLVDFGLSLKYCDNNGQHIKQLQGQPMIGTARFTPICSHQGRTQNRASDFESLGYLMIYFLKGTLPWMGIEAKTREEKFYLIGQKKQSISTEALCHGIPQEFISYFNYIFNLHFDTEPSYAYIRKTFRNLFLRSRFEQDYRFDWTVQPEVKEHSIRTERVHLTQILEQKSQQKFQNQEPIMEQYSSESLHQSNEQKFYIAMKQSFGQRLDTSEQKGKLKESSHNKAKLKESSHNRDLRKSITMNIITKPPPITQISNNASQDSELDFKQPLQFLMQQDQQQFMFNRLIQHNSILSKISEQDQPENIRFEDSNEYFPYQFLYQKLESFNNQHSIQIKQRKKSS